ncbi:hypothetical protein Sgly_2400 [Syntrophobotulus glycolicus DSM 8271]|uniref:Uncharacterized protein n=1 Tax=Syntrophobotulus glycolicus (strain DSM 8271 / FlGlyR) TaxID=645991 RepID=F0SUX1_SYNGF|nr:hypothetical protein Sgly_2400 [Syntrophobotulus glycolicus DSM 8271]
MSEAILRTNELPKAMAIRLRWKMVIMRLFF